MSEALRRRCIFLHVDYPDSELEERIVEVKVPGLEHSLTESVVRVINALRAMPLRKAPSVSETIDWARTLLALGAAELDEDTMRDSLGVILKHRSDHEKAQKLLDMESALAR